jgi:probable HAF family extracellular repeat protein
MQPAATQIDDLRDFAFLTEPYPCENCRHAARCKASLEACPAFSLYVAHAGELRWGAAPRMPTRALFETIFAEPSPAKARTPKRPRLLTAEERRRRNTLRKQRWRKGNRGRESFVATYHQEKARPEACSSEEITMKTRSCSLILVTALLALAIPLSGAAAQKHHHYKVVDIGTFGGPQSYFNNLHLGDRFGFGTAFYGFARVSNGPEVLVGFADTATPDPYSANPLFCYVPDCFIAHAYKLHDSVKTDLGVLPGDASSAAFWINSSGVIAGNSQNGQTDPLVTDLPELRAVIWKHGQIEDLGTLGGSSSFTQAINNRGQVTGVALNGVADPFSFYYQFLICFPSLSLPPQFQVCPPNATQTRAFIWDAENGMEDIGTLGGPDAGGFLINNRGQVAGFSYTDAIPADPNTHLPPTHPFLWERGKGMRDLGTFGGVSTAAVNGLNERGDVVGGSDLPGDQQIHPFLWDGKKLIDLIAPPFGGSANGEAVWINEAGEVVGLAGLPVSCPGSPQAAGEVQHAFQWRKGVMTDLGTLTGIPNSEANFVNSKSQIVGDAFACDFSVFTATLWENASIVDLNTLVPANTPLYLFMASFIDDRGQIAAFGNLANGDTHAVLLIPCDEGHPNVEGCDYSLVEATSATQRTAAANQSHPVPKALLQNLGSRRFGFRRP